MRFRLLKKAGAVVAAAVGGGAIVTLWAVTSRDDDLLVHASSHEDVALRNKVLTTPLPSREQHLASMRERSFDVLVIGGGATGVGVALDSVSRGLKTCLIEKMDFAAGTSSRSTKLIHGGVRYLQKAILGLDREQYKMVKEALHERAHLIHIAPHLAYPLPIMLPVYKWYLLPYYYAGIKAYDLVAGRQLLRSSYILSKSKSLELFPMLKEDKLVGAIVYYDGQQNDARMCLSIALTAARLGASVVNHAEVVRLLKTTDSSGKEVLSGARVRDSLTGDEFEVKAKCIVNAAGPFTDHIREMDTPEVRKICQPSSGVHIVLPDYYSPANMGLIDPSTSDGRVIFFLPWQNSTMAGTTDHPCEVTTSPAPTEDEVQFILEEIRNYLNPDVNVKRGDVLSCWSGIRPLVLNPSSADTQSIARNHIIEVSDSNLITIAGGKWTTYREMAEQTVDKAVQVCKLPQKRPCCTTGLLVEGAHNWSPTMFIRLIQDFGIDNRVAKHLSATYGDRAFKVAKLAQLTGKRWPVVGRRLHEDYPYIEAEVVYAVREYAVDAIDILARRTRLAFLNVHAAQEALPRVIEILAQELKWNEEKKKQEYDRTMQFLNVEMGLRLKDSKRLDKAQLDDEELTTYIKRFQALDFDNKGFITVSDLRKYFKKTGEKVTETQINDILSEVDLNKNAEVDVDEFLQLMVALKTGSVSTSRFARAAEQSERMAAISIYRSGGGV